PEIRNPLVVPLLFGLVPFWRIKEQQLVFSAFQVLLRGTGPGGGMVNRSVCCDVQPSLLDQVGDGGGGGGGDVQGMVIDLIGYLGSHSITVAQLKRIFRLMQPISGTRDTTKPQGVGVRGMMSNVPGPQRFFLLDGVASGLLLPPIPRWPAHRGYTFCAWLRMEAPGDDGGQP
ncbi:unnamed protein product, partial [Discosporangium mesarthrocarpum]